MQAKSTTDIKGIDVSHYQGSIDWKKVAADGVKYAIIKATDGMNFVDPKLKQNADGAIAAGIGIAFYHYARPDRGSIPEAEAAHFAKNIKPWKWTFPNVLDVEGEAADLGADKLTAWCLRFLNELKRLTGHDVMVYTGASFANSYLRSPLKGFPLWVAHYNNKIEKPLLNRTWSTWALWQYTDTGRVSGIGGNVDINRMTADFYAKYTKPVQQKEDEKPMTPAEQKRMKELEAKVQQLEKELADQNTLKSQIKELSDRIKLDSVPSWSKKSVDKVVAAGALTDAKDLSYDLVRTLVILDRLGMLPIGK